MATWRRRARCARALLEPTPERRAAPSRLPRAARSERPRVPPAPIPPAVPRRALPCCRRYVSLKRTIAHYRTLHLTQGLVARSLGRLTADLPPPIPPEEAVVSGYQIGQHTLSLRVSRACAALVGQRGSAAASAILSRCAALAVSRRPDRVAPCRCAAAIAGEFRLERKPRAALRRAAHARPEPQQADFAAAARRPALPPLPRRLVQHARRDRRAL